jgi:hypothetical protein
MAGRGGGTGVCDQTKEQSFLYWGTVLERPLRTKIFAELFLKATAYFLSSV